MKQYLIITAGYWAFTLTDGALRMLVVLHFHQLGFSPLDVALLFLFYELFGVVTNLVGGWLAARLGLATTMIAGLVLQVGALSMLLVDPAWLTVAYVMVAQALSGIAKDLNKMSAKSGVKLVADDGSQLYRWVAILTGSKNALKGVGYFIGGLMLTAFGFQGAVATMAGALAVASLATLFLLDLSAGRTTFKPKFTDVFSKSGPVNRLSAARLFLFGSRDVWFVVALPVYLQLEQGWSNVAVGTLLALWIIGYGAIQSGAPLIARNPDGRTAVLWGAALAVIPATMAALGLNIVTGVLLFGAIFAINSAVHSFLIVSYADRDGVSLDVGFYYMSNAAGRLFGTVLSGWLYQAYGIEVCLLASAVMVAVATGVSVGLPRTTDP